MLRIYHFLFCLLPIAFPIVIGSLFAVSCTSEQKEVIIPADVLPKEKMSEIIIDIHLTEAKANISTLPGAAPDSTYPDTKQIDALYSKHGVTPEQYDRSMQFYTGQPELLNEIYDEVMQELSKMQSGQE